MANDFEKECIAQSRKAKLLAAKNRLIELEKNGVRFDGPTSGLGIKWKKNVAGIITQILFLPVALVLVLFLFAMTPFAYVSHFQEVSKKKQQIKDEIQKLESEPLSAQLPDEKVLLYLWKLHGLDKLKYSYDERINLLAIWIEILYGKGILEKSSLQSKFDEIAKSHGRLNKPYYDGKKDAAHFLCINPFDALIHKISEELPAYE